MKPLINYDGTKATHIGTSRALGTSNVRVGRPLGNANANNAGSSATGPFYGLSGVFVVGEDVEVPETWSLIPSGLGAGDRFRLIFLSSTDRQAKTTNITDYNSWIQTRAAAGHADIRRSSSLFRAVGSTSFVDARDNTSTTYTDDDKGVPIYWLGGNKVADDYADFYDGAWDDEANAKDESGEDRSTSTDADLPYTGSAHDGTLGYDDQGISRALGLLTTWVGRPNTAGPTNGPLSSASDIDFNERHPLYGLSAVFRVTPAEELVETTVPPDWSLVPSDLGAGDSFRLLFIGSTQRNASDSDIGVYNTFVQNLVTISGHADIRDHSSTFRMLGSTEAVDARDNTATTYTADDTGVPIYWLGGNKVADDYADFYDGDWDEEASGAGENGDSVDIPDTRKIWTGSAQDGTEAMLSGTSRALGNSGNNFVMQGSPNGNDSAHGPIESNTTIRSTNRGVYGLSGVFVVSAAPITGDFDLHDDNGDPRGVWGNDDTIWVSNSPNGETEGDKIFAYDRSTGSRDGDKDFNTLNAAGNNTPARIWSDGETMFVLDSDDAKVYAYKMSDKSHDESKDITVAADNGSPRGIWGNHETIWVSDTSDDKLYAYKRVEDEYGTRDYARDFNTLRATGNTNARGIWSDGLDMFVADTTSGARKVYSYSMFDMAHRPARGFNLDDENSGPAGMWGDDGTLWVVDVVDDKLYAYGLPPTPEVSVAASPRRVAGGGLVTLTGMVTDPDAGPLTYAWSSSGDLGTFAGASAPSATWTAPDATGEDQTVTLTLTVTGVGGATRTATADVVVSAPITGGFDLHYDNSNARGIWGNADTIWVSNSPLQTDDGDKIFAYDRSTRVRDEGKDFNTLNAAGNNTPTRIWSDGETMFVLDSFDHRVYAYNMNDKARDDSKDIALAADNDNSQGIWGNGETIWVSDNYNDKLFAYKRVADEYGMRDTDRDFNTLGAAGNTNVKGIWSDGTDMFVADTLLYGRVFAYSMSDMSHRPARSFNLDDDNSEPAGVWGDDGTLWVVDVDDNKLYTYDPPSPPAVSVEAFPLHVVSGDSLTLTGTAAEPEGHTLTYAWTSNGGGTFADTTALSTTWTAPDATVANQTVTLTLTVTDTEGETGTATVDVLVSPPAPIIDDDFGLHEDNAAPRGIWGNDDTIWVSNITDDKIYAYARSTGLRDEDKDFDTLSDAGNTSPTRIWSDGETMLVLDPFDEKVYAYNMDDKARDDSKDIALAAGNGSPQGIWGNDRTIWVSDDAGNKLFAYKRVNDPGTPDNEYGTRDADSDFNTLMDAGNAFSRGIWSDGMDMFVVDTTSAAQKVFSYSMSDMSHRPARSFDLEEGNDHPAGIWSDGATLWVVDQGDDKLYAYGLPAAENQPPTSTDATLSALSLSGFTLSPSFAADTLTYTASVGNDVASTTVTAAANHDGATVAIVPADADDTADGHQVALAVGNTAVSVTVTAEDGTTMQTYAVTVTRADVDESAETTVPSNWSLVPQGLGAGDRFRLIFLSSTTRDGASTDIADYNTFVQTAAAAGHPGIRQYSAGFRVVGSTADVDARDNTRTTYTDDDKGVPIYWLGLNSVDKVADDYEDFYDGSWAIESAFSNEAGSKFFINEIWNVPTGSNHDGTEAFDGTTSRAFGSAFVRLGKMNSTASGDGPLSSAQNAGILGLRPLYALSQVFLVGEPRATAAPAFSADSATRDVAENSAVGANVGNAVTAADTDGDALTYTLEGTDAASFIIDASTGQIQTKADVTYDHEANSSYSVTVKADDNYGGADTIAVTINITDVDEPPAAPAVPTVVAVAGTSDSLSVRWLAPDNAGKPDIDSYDLQYRKGTTGDFTDGPQDQTDKMATITGLDANSAYEVHVRASNDEGDGAWSSPGTGATHADVLVGNLTEAFPFLTTKPIELDWAQAFDTGSNTEGYRLESIALRNTGADTEAGTLTVTVRADSSGSPGAAVLYTLTNPEEFGAGTTPASASLEPGLLAFTAPAGATLDPNTTYWVVFIWDADRHDGLNKGGPRFIKTRLRHGIDAGGAPGWTIDAPAQKRKTQVIASWDVPDAAGAMKIQVRGAPNGDPDSNAPPAFAAEYATREVPENSAAGTSVGDPVVATDSDPGATLTYTLEGYDAASFEIDAASGQIRTKSGVAYDFEQRGSYLVTVKADDGNEQGADTIAVTINITDVDESAETTVPADWSLIPSGLGAGDRFRLIFATSGKRNATSTDIADYNSFVQTSAAAGHADIQQYSSGFRVVGSTAAVDARDNTRTTYTADYKGVPIYWLNGNKVADDYEDFYDGGWDDETNPKNENGADSDVSSSSGTDVHTGSNHDGTEWLGGAVSQSLGSSDVRGGILITDGAGPLYAQFTQTSGSERPFWALSQVFVVAGTAVTSDDATLSALSLSDIMLLPGFAADTLTYTASVDNDVASTTVTATANDDGATVAIVPADADDTADGHQVALAVGDTAISVTVTAEDGTTTQTYAVTVTRAEAVEVKSITMRRTDGRDGEPYRIGDELIFVVEFSHHAACVSSGTSAPPGKSVVRFYIGTSLKEALSYGSEDLTQLHRYTVEEGDLDTDGITIPAGPEALPDTYTKDSCTGPEFDKTGIAAQGPLEDRKVDGVRPTPEFAVTSDEGDSIIIVFSEPLAETTAPASAFTLTVDTGTAPTISSATASGNSVTLALASALTRGRAVTVAYSDATSGDDDAVQDAVGNDAASFTTGAGGVPAVANAVGTGCSLIDGCRVVPADWSLIPSGLGASDRFRLIFISSGTRDGSSSDIDDYNTFVQNAADAGHADIQSHSSTFGVVGSTADVDARDNTDTTYTDDDKGVSIYWLGGNKVADDYEDFYDGDWADEANAKDESGNDRSTSGQPLTPNSDFPFTGSNHDGTESTSALLGSSRALGGDSVRIGWLNSATSGNGPLSSGTSLVSGAIRPLYGLSGVFVVPAAAMSDDATLSELSLSGVTLSPSFAADTLAYTASVGNDVASTTVTATATHDGATVAIVPVDADDTADGHQVTLGVGDTAVSVTVTAEDGTTTQTYAVTVTRAAQAAPAVSDVDVTSEPGDDDTYAIGDTIQVTVTFDQAVTVTGAPRIQLRVGGGDAVHQKWADYTSGSGNEALLFAYTVQADDFDDNGIYIAADELELNGGTIQSSDGADAILDYSQPGGQSGHNVDGVRPTPEFAVTSDDGISVIIIFSEPLSETTAPASAFTLSVDTGTAPVVTGASASGNSVTLALASALTSARVVTVAYTKATLGNDAVAVQDAAGNDAVNFTTGAGEVPAVVNAVGTGCSVTDGCYVVPADWGLIPSDLGPGDSFRLIFISTSSSNANSSDIDDYNTFVQNLVAASGHEAIQAHSGTFRMLGSTEDVDARDNTATTYTDDDKGVPIYWLDGAKVADDYADFYDGDWDEEATGARENGDSVSIGNNWKIWTGSAEDGTEAMDTSSGTSRALGNSGNHWVMQGSPNGSDSAHGPIESDTIGRGTSRGVYGLSGVFRVEGQSTDATLSALSLSDVMLSPSFAADTLAYTGSVDNSVTSTTVTATANHDGATVAIVPADADDTADGHQVALAIGDTAISVTVTAEDGTTTQTYAVTVTRAEKLAVTITADPTTVNGGGTVQLGSTVTGDSGTVFYSWSTIGFGTLSSTSIHNPVWTASPASSSDIGGRIDLEVIDSTGSAFANVLITVRGNQAPEVSATADPASVAGGGAVTLDGTATDPEGDTLTYAWTSDGGGSFADAGALETTWTAPGAARQDQPVTLTLTVTDDGAGTRSTTQTLSLTVRANEAPAGSVSAQPETVLGGKDVQLTSSVADPEIDALTYAWTSSGGGAFANASAANTRWTAPAAATADQTVTLTLTVTDTVGETAFSTDVTVRANQPPTVVLGSIPTEVGGGASLFLVVATATDPEGDTLTYAWTSDGGGSFGDAGAPDTFWVSPEATDADQTVMLTLTVTDDGAGPRSASVTVVVTVKAQSQLAVTIAADPSTVNGGGTVMLSTTVTGAVGDVQYGWQPGSDGTFSDTSVSNPVWTAGDAASSDRNKILTLFVVDDVTTATATVQITVRGNQAPEVSATAAPASVAGGGTVTLDGTATDPEGDTLTYAWTSDGGGSFADAGALDTTWTAPDATSAVQTIMLTLTATDDGAGARSASNTVTVTVEALDNTAPAFTTGTDFSTDENQTISFQVKAMDADAADTVSYAITGGADQAKFDIDASSGVLTFKDAPDHENPGDADSNNDYLVTVTATGGTGARALMTDQAITVTVNDVDEPPSAPAAPTVSPVSGTTDSLSVSWTAPDNSGKPDIESYDLQYRKGTIWIDGPQDETGLTATIGGLDAATAYQVQVRATNDEGDGAWSSPGSGSTGAAAAPAVSSVDVTSEPGDDDTYAIGDTIQVTVTFDQAVTVTGAPRIKLRVGGGDAVHQKWAGYTSGSGNEALLFAYTVEAGDFDDNGIYIAADELELNGGTIQSSGGTDANLDYPLQGGQSGHNVDGVRPTPEFAVTSVDGSSVIIVFSESLSATTAAASAFTLSVVTGTAPAVSTATATGDTVTLGLASALTSDQVVTVTYTDSSQGDDSAAVQDAVGNDADTFTQTVTNNAAIVVSADWGLIPTGLGAGAEFRLLFRTSGTRNAASTDIADYNTFVQTAAAAGHADIQSHSSTFRVLGSTADVDARDNTFTTYTADDKGVLIYWLNGNKVADDYEDFYDGSWSNADGGKDEHGADRAPPVIALNVSGTWTGSASNGTEAITGNDAFALGASDVRIGQPLDSTLSGGNTLVAAFYGLSGVFRVAGQVVTNTAPAFTTVANFSTNENQAATFQVTAEDADAGDAVTYAITGGADLALFSINATSGLLAIPVSVDHENPADADGNNVYLVTVTATGGTGARALTADQAITVTVTDVDEPPSAPATPTVSAVSDSSDSLSVTWTAPEQRRQAGHRVLRPAIPQGDHRQLCGRPAGRDRHQRHHRRAGRRLALPGAGTGHQRRGRRRLVECGQRHHERAGRVRDAADGTALERLPDGGRIRRPRQVRVREQPFRGNARPSHLRRRHDHLHRLSPFPQ